MKKIVTAFALSLTLAASPVLAHHPAADTAPEDIYAMVDELVSDTPHATMVFDDTMGMNDTTTITVPSVTAAEDLIDDYLLSAISVVDEAAIITITFGEYYEAETEVEADSNSAQTSNKWTESEDWGRSVIITVDTLLCDPDSVVGCVDITDN